MKGLLLKDWYMMKKYCRSYLFIAAVFVAVSLANKDNLFFAFYPCVLCGMIPVNLLSYDERSHWMQYSGALPYTKAQIVSAKYLIGLFAQVTMLIVTGSAQGIKMIASGTFVGAEYVVLMLLMLIISTTAASITLPLAFKLGVEKGRIAYYAMIGFICVASIWASGFFQGQLLVEIKPSLLLAMIAVAGITIYILSWCMSVLFYKKREIC